MAKKSAKRGRGRPKLKGREDTKLIQFRVPVEVAVKIEGAMAALKLLNQDVHTPVAVLWMECLRARLNQLQNRNSSHVERAIRALDKALEFYGHLER